MRVVALRGTLRYWSQPHGVQQSRKLRNARKRDGGILSASVSPRLFVRVQTSRNKWWARPVPAAAVTPAPQVGTTFIGSKASVAGLLNAL